MANSFKEASIIGVPTVGQSFFGNPANSGQTVFSPDSLIVEIDIQRGNERLAALIPRGINARPLGTTQKNVNVTKYTNITRKYPLIEEEGDLESTQLLLRTAGEMPYAGNKTQKARMRELARDIHNEQIKRIVRKNETLAWQSLFDGEQDIITGGEKYDFYRRAAHIITPTSKWDAVAGAWIDDVDTGWGLIRANGHVNADGLIVGGGAMDAMIKDATSLALSDNRRYELLEINEKMPVPNKFARYVEAGLTARGRLMTPRGHEIWMFTYDDGYTNSSGNFTLYVPTNQALLFSTQGRCDRHFGPRERMPFSAQDRAWYQDMFGMDPAMAAMPAGIKSVGSVVPASQFYCDAYMGPAAKAISLRTQSAPIFATTMTDAFVTFKSVLT
jgi:hypothetical protein